MSTLLLMRHAKSDWDASHASDHDRPLNERGRRSARVMGRLLTSLGLIPDLVVTSTAVRAATTAELAAAAGDWAAAIVPEPRLYGTGTDAAVDVVAETPPTGTLLLVGHQPTWGALAVALTGERVDMRTATVAVISFPLHAWSAIGGTRGRLIEVHQPADHMGSHLDLD